MAISSSSPNCEPVDLIVGADGAASFDGRRVRCAVGRSGISAAKREGDGTTPAGRYICRWFYWRADRIAEPRSGLGRRPLSLQDGWCDDPGSACYNRYLSLPSPAHHELLWRQDALYDIVVVLGYNDAPAIPDLGSAIFLHLAAEDYAPTAGCIALAANDLMDFLAVAEPGSGVVIAPGRL